MVDYATRYPNESPKKACLMNPHAQTYAAQPSPTPNIVCGLPLLTLSCEKPTADALFGVKFFSVDGVIKVTSVTVGGLAHDAGVRITDTLHYINGESVTGANEAVRLLKSAPTGQIELVVQRHVVQSL